jgi:hypothetical protein
MYWYQIRIQVSDTLWVEVSMFHRQYILIAIGFVVCYCCLVS